MEGNVNLEVVKGRPNNPEFIVKKEPSKLEVVKGRPKNIIFEKPA